MIVAGDQPDVFTRIVAEFLQGSDAASQGG